MTAEAAASAEAPHAARTRFLFIVFSLAPWACLWAYFATAHGRLDFQGEPVGRDFINAWTAARLVAAGHALVVFDPVKFLAAERAMFDPAAPIHFWSYPPTALLTVAPLGRL